MQKKVINVVFSRYNRYVFNKYNRKHKDDYILNIDKITKNKIKEDLNVMNKYQAFILNYEISKLLDKVIKSDETKYNSIYYVNQNMSITSILNFINLIKKSYKNIDFYFTLYYDDDDSGLISTIASYIDAITLIKK